METQINVIEKPGIYEITGYDELKATLSDYVSQYADAKFDCTKKESRQAAKGIMADLRSKKAQIEDKRKEIKKSALNPYNEFADKCKELTGMIDKTVSGIDKQLKDWDAEQKEKKQESLEKKFGELTSPDFRELVPFSYVLDQKWLNQSTSTTKATSEMVQKIHKAKEEIASIEVLPETEKEFALATYKSTHDMNAVMLKLADFRKAIEADRKRRDEEARRQAEEERRRIEAEAQKKAEEKAEQLYKERIEQKEEPPKENFLEIPDMDIPEETPTEETKSIWFKITGTPDELEQVRIFLNSIGLEYLEREA